VLAVLGLCILLFAGPYATLTYITPFLEQVTGISGPVISVFLLAYGAATAVGAFGGGRFADRNASKAILVANVVLVIALAMLYAVGKVPILVAVALILWGVVGFGLVPSLQYRVVSLAGPGRDLATTLPASAINAGIAIGALIGGWALASHGPKAPVVTGIVISIIALPVAWFTGWLKPLDTVENATETGAGSADASPATA
jgi:DHA1 family inner membrane transport protein